MVCTGITVRMDRVGFSPDFSRLRFESRTGKFARIPGGVVEAVYKEANRSGRSTTFAIRHPELRGELSGGPELHFPSRCIANVRGKLGGVQGTEPANGDLAPRFLKQGADGRVTRTVPGARQRLMLPHPCRLALVAAKGFHRRYQEAGGAIGADRSRTEPRRRCAR